MKLHFDLETKDEDFSFFKAIAIFFVAVSVGICIYFLTKNKYHFLADIKNEMVEATPITSTNKNNNIDM